MRTVLILVALGVCGAGVAAAQSHDAPAGTTAPKATNASGDHAAAPADTTPARPKPTVSRIVAPRPATATSPVAHEAPGGGAHDATAAAPPKKGYVAVGAKAGGAAVAHAPEGKPKPVVSGAETLAAREPAHPTTDEHGAAAGPASGGSRKPVKLSEVHGRLASALADALKPAAGRTAADGNGHDDRPAGHRAPAHVTLVWPGPRWTVAWPTSGRRALTWPDMAADSSGPRRDPH
jgi:hypothetical protein